MMKTSQTGIDLIKRFEGLELESYQDIAGVWTIGYGHTKTYPSSIPYFDQWSDGVGEGQTITEPLAEQLLIYDLKSRERAIERYVNVLLSQNEFDALVSFVYNVGAAAFAKSTCRKRLNDGDYSGTADAMTWFNKATVDGVLQQVNGLTRRRAAERALFLTPVAIDERPNNPGSDDYIEDEYTRRNPGVEIRPAIEVRSFWARLLRRVVRIFNHRNAAKHGD